MQQQIAVNIDPFASLNEEQIANALSAIIAGYKAGDQAIVNALDAYKAQTNTRLDDLEALIELQPEHVEDAFKKLLADPALLAMLAGSLTVIPGTRVSIGSFCAAMKAAPQSAGALFTVNGSGEFVSANVTLVRDDVVTIVPFSPTTTRYDEDGDGFEEKAVQVWTGQYDGLTLTFEFTAAVRQKLLGAGIAPLVMHTLVGSKAMTIDLSGYLVNVGPTPEIVPIDVDGDGQIGTAPAPIG